VQALGLRGFDVFMSLTERKVAENLYAIRDFSGGGLLGNQNTVCQPRVAKWRHTVERLKTVFKGWGG
jgi:hypothetical protein